MATNSGKILVVDDEDLSCDLVRDALQQVGYTVHTAQSSSEAMSLLLANDYDVAILDYMMPKGDGKFLWELIHSAKPELAGRTIVITGAPASRRLLDFLASAKIPFLRKPFEIDRLVDLVRAVE
jgi:DNA-binding NtrC family response regulator